MSVEQEYAMPYFLGPKPAQGTLNSSQGLPCRTLFLQWTEVFILSSPTEQKCFLVSCCWLPCFSPCKQKKCPLQYHVYCHSSHIIETVTTHIWKVLARDYLMGWGLPQSWSRSCCSTPWTKSKWNIIFAPTLLLHTISALNSELYPLKLLQKLRWAITCGIRQSRVKIYTLSSLFGGWTECPEGSITAHILAH